MSAPGTEVSYQISLTLRERLSQARDGFPTIACRTCQLPLRMCPPSNSVSPTRSPSSLPQDSAHSQIETEHQETRKRNKEYLPAPPCTYTNLPRRRENQNTPQTRRTDRKLSSIDKQTSTNQFTFAAAVHMQSKLFVHSHNVFGHVTTLYFAEFRSANMHTNAVCKNGNDVV